MSKSCSTGRTGPVAARRPRTAVMLAYPFEEKRLAKWRLPWLVQYKYNGLRCLAVNNPTTGVDLISSTGLPIRTVPHIKQAVRDLPFGVYDGELYLHGNFQRLTSIVMRGDVSPDHTEVSYKVFDAKLDYPQQVRLAILDQLRPALPPFITVADTWYCTSTDEIEAILENAMGHGYEGLILREPQALYQEKRTTTMMKLKPRSSDTYRVVGFAEEISIHGEPKGRLGSLLVQDQDGQSFRVGSGFTAAQRAEYWQDRNKLSGRLVSVKYQALTDRGVPWFPVFLDLQAN